MVDKSRRSFLGKVALLGAGAGFLVKFEGATPNEVRESMTEILKDVPEPELEDLKVPFENVGLPEGPIKVRGALRVHKPIEYHGDTPDPSFVHLGKFVTVRDYQAVHDQIFKHTDIARRMVERRLSIESVYARGNMLLWRIIDDGAVDFKKNKNDDNSLWVASTVPSTDQRAIHHTNIVDKRELIKFTSLYGD